MSILSIDFGTSSAKIAILNSNLETLQSIKQEYSYETVGKDRVEMDPELVMKQTFDGIKKIEEKHINNIKAIIYDVFSPSLVCMDKQGKSIFPCIFYLDKRSRKQSRLIIRKFGREKYLNITGVLPFSGGVTITSLLWIKGNCPDIYKDSFKFGHFDTYVCKKLTGEWAIDYVNASMTGLYETTKWGGWSKDICNAFDISIGKLPKIKKAGHIVGGLKAEIASYLGIKEGTPVVLGSNDAATAILGADNTNPGEILNIAGSNEICTILTDKPIVNKDYYLRNSIYEKKWQIFGINIGGFAVEWFRKQAFRDMNKKFFYNKYLANLIDDKIDLERINNATEKFKPYLAGDRHSIEKKRGCLSGLTLDSDRDNMLIAILVGIHEPVLNNIKAAGNFLELNKNIAVTGGLSEGSYFSLKKKLLKGFNLKFKKRCTTRGNGKLAFKSLEK